MEQATGIEPAWPAWAFTLGEPRVTRPDQSGGGVDPTHRPDHQTLLLGPAAPYTVRLNGSRCVRRCLPWCL
jgi:hypothetical protein